MTVFEGSNRLTHRECQLLIEEGGSGFCVELFTEVGIFLYFRLTANKYAIAPKIPVKKMTRIHKSLYSKSRLNASTSIQIQKITMAAINKKLNAINPSNSDDVDDSIIFYKIDY